jgi:aminopeptidase N
MKHLVIAVGDLTVGGERRESDVTLTALTVPRLKGTAESSLEMAARIVRLFTEHFGPCPYREIQLVLFEAAKPGGHSPPGLTLLAHRPVALGPLSSDDPANFSDQPGFFLAHEIAHQWWGDGVAAASYHDRWISEAAAHYAAALWIRHSRGEEEFRSVMREMERWALSMNEAGAISLGYRVGHLDGDPKLYRAVVYDKGACVLNTLRRLLGDEAFHRGLTRFQAGHRFAKAGTPHLRKALEEAGGRDLGPYFEAWIYGTSVPVLSLSTHTQPSPSGGFRTALRVEAQELPGPVPLEIRLEKETGHESRVEMLTPPGGSWEFDTVYAPRRLRVNDDAGLLARIRD